MCVWGGGGVNRVLFEEDSTVHMPSALLDDIWTTGFQGSRDMRAAWFSWSTPAKAKLRKHSSLLAR